MVFGDRGSGDRSPLGPGDDVLGAVVPAGKFLIRAERVMVALSHLIVYPHGCALEIREAALVQDMSDVFDRMVFAAQFGADVSARLYDKTAPRWRPDGRPALMLTELGSEGTSGGGRVDRTRKLWLSPLPPPEPGSLSVIAPDLGPEAWSCQLDGRAIVAASSAAQPYWP